jgi:hypothetical protein
MFNKANFLAWLLFVNVVALSLSLSLSLSLLLQEFYHFSFFVPLSYFSFGFIMHL